MKKLFLFFFALLTIQSYGQLSGGEKGKIDSLFKTWNNTASPGAIVGVVKDRKLVYTKGYGMADLEHSVPVTDSTVFYIGSVSKQFVAVALLLLEEEGKINMEDRIQKYLPDFPKYEAPITLRHLAQHTSGVRDNLTLWTLAGNNDLDQMDKNEMYQLVRRQKELNFKPGDRHSYSNSGYFLLALVIEKASGMSVNEYARKNIFEPLGMKNTFFGDDNSKIIKNRAFSYVMQGGNYKNQVMRYDLVGSGGVYSTIRDLYLWDLNLYENKLGKKSEELIKRLHATAVLNDGTSTNYALGIQYGTYRGEIWGGHTGAFAGYRAAFLRMPRQEFSVIILGNASSVSSRLVFGVADVVLEKKLAASPQQGEGTGNNGKEEQKPYTLEDTKPYTGSYYSEELDVVYRVTENSGQLYYSIRNKKGVALRPHSKDVFLTQNGVQLKFERNANNAITGFALEAGRVKNLKFKQILLPL